MSAKGWRKRAPKTVAERRALLARCGPSAFLDPKNLKYPIMAKSGACVVDCAGAAAARSRAAQYGARVVKAKAARASRSCVLAGYADLIPGGRAAGRRPSDFDPRQLALGIRVEMEHTRDRRLAREIAMDHLTEDARYYDKLLAVGL